MSVKLADTLAPMGDFAIGESKDIDIEINGTNKRLQQAYEDGDLGGGSSSIQVDTMPIASAENENMIVEFVGESGTYQNGYFYQNIGSGDPKVYSWVQKNVQPSNATATDVSYDNTTSELVATNVQDAIDEIKGGLGTASGKNFTDLVRPNSHELVESGSVYSAINNALSSIYTPRGELTCAELTSSLLIEDNVGNIYTMSDSGTTSALFINGAGQTINAKDNVGIIKAGADTYLFNLMGDAFDLHDYQKKELSTTIASATTVEGVLSALNNGKVTKYNYTMVGTASLEDDIKTFVTALIALGANTYVGFFNRSGNLGTAGNYSITIYAEEGTSTFASGYIAFGAGALGKIQYEVSYYKPTGSSEEWIIKQLATEKDMVASSSSIKSLQALLEDVQPQLWIEGTYQGALIINDWGVGTYQMTKTNNTSANHKTVIYGTFSTASDAAQPFIATYTSSNVWHIVYTALKSYVDAKVREVFRVPYNISIANFLARFTQIGIYKGEVFIEDSIGGTAINHWCSYDVTISSDTEVYVGDIKLTDLETGDIYVYESYGVGAFSWNLVGKFIKSCEGFISPNQSLTVTLENFTCARGNLVVQGYGGWNLQLRQLGQSSKVYAETSDENNFVKIVEQNNTIVNIITISNPEYNKLVLTNVGSETEHFWFVGVKDWVVN